MNRVKKGLDNQAIGLLPLLLFMFLDNYFSYLLSFIIGVTFCFVCIFLFQVLSEEIKFVQGSTKQSTFKRGTFRIAYTLYDRSPREPHDR